MTQRDSEVYIRDDKPTAVEQLKLVPNDKKKLQQYMSSVLFVKIPCNTQWMFVMDEILQVKIIRVAFQNLWLSHSRLMPCCWSIFNVWQPAQGGVLIINAFKNC